MKCHLSTHVCHDYMRCILQVAGAMAHHPGYPSKPTRAWDMNLEYQISSPIYVTQYTTQQCCKAQDSGFFSNLKLAHYRGAAGILTSFHFAAECELCSYPQTAAWGPQEHLESQESGAADCEVSHEES